MPHRQADLNGSIPAVLLAGAPARQFAIPTNKGLEINRQRTPALDCYVLYGPVPSPTDRVCRSAHASPVPRCIQVDRRAYEICNIAQSMLIQSENFTQIADFAFA